MGSVASEEIVVEKLCAEHRLAGSDRSTLAEFAQLVSTASYVPIPERDLEVRRIDVAAGHQMNVIEGNPGTPLARAKSDLLVAYRVPAHDAVELLVKFGFG